MRTKVALFLMATLPLFAQAQILSDDPRFPLLRQFRWDMGRADVLAICVAGKIQVAESDSAVTFSDAFFGLPVRVSANIGRQTGRIRDLELRFKQIADGLPDSLVKLITLFVGDAPTKIQKEKNLLLFTMRMEITMWRTKTDKIVLVVAKKNQAVFDSYIRISPLTD